MSSKRVMNFACVYQTAFQKRERERIRTGCKYYEGRAQKKRKEEEQVRSEKVCVFSIFFSLFWNLIHGTEMISVFLVTVCYYK